MSTTIAPSSTAAGGPSVTDFADAADKACLAVFPKVEALDDPDGEGDNKPLGLGRVVRDWADELAAIEPPAAIADDWEKATSLLRRSGVRLDDAERLAAVGDPGADDAQNEALWELQPAASEIIMGLDIPFRVCSFE